ncbi:MAG TPA: TonB-dependent siderophore receptor, partial [Gemmatimonadales bacterium]|nr:TonB-dependent siderophore receptor [Gemmatimonadales bacterium]
MHLLAAGLAAHALPGHAQTAAPATLPEIRVEAAGESGYAAGRSSTAVKTDTPLVDTPQSITVVTPQELRDRAVQSVAEAARYVPGVGFAQGEGNRETPVIRGIATTGDFFIDGVRDDVQYFRDLYNIERVEVFKGPNAMIFGRGATGGLINRVAKVPEWTRSLAGSLTVGSHDSRRLTVDLGQPLGESLAVRLTGLLEKSGSYRDGVTLDRKGVNPTLAWRVAPSTLVTAGYERFEDDRTADRGVSSFRGRPLDTDPSTFFGDPERSPTWTRLDAATLLVEHEFGGGVQLRNRTRWSDQDKFYQNVFPGAVDASGTNVAINAYNNATQRESVFNQTDLVLALHTGRVKHTVLAGLELGRQRTANRRLTGFFAGDATSVTVPVANPRTSAPVTFRPSATDADNRGEATVAALYLQDQVELGAHWLLVAGVRADRFEMDFTNHRTGQDVRTRDDLVSPRLGVVWKPLPAASVYANYSVAHLPRAGDQLASLTLANAALEPEKFSNVEVGAKWDVRPGLALTAAAYRLDRTNVVVLDPSDPGGARTMLSDGQRTQGIELGANGRITPAWSVAGGYAYTEAEFTADTTATLRAGAAVAQVPRHTFSLWNRYDFTPALGAGLGIVHRTRMLAGNELAATAATPSPNVELPAYTRVDAALYLRIDARVTAQLNVENL